jgi:predicted NBD/HSP70 family sugar kinase
MSLEIKVVAPTKPLLDPEFVPAVLWNKEYQKMVAEAGNSCDIVIALERGIGTVSVFKTAVFPHEENYRSVNIKYVERLIKTLLWTKGGYKVTIAGCEALADDIKKIYSPDGVRKFDYEFMGEKIYGKTFEVVSCSLEDAPESNEIQVSLGGNMDGCRIGFDLGGSDRKCAAVIDGEVVHSEEVEWDPYFQSDPQYHFDGIMDSLTRAASKMPRVDAIGGSAAGVYVDNCPRVASLFRGVNDDDFQKHVINMFRDIQKKFDNVPMIIANDGDVTALAGAISMETVGVLGIAMGTSEAVGYVNANGNITDWLNELAFSPVDYRDDAPADEWSGDIGCGAQYFSQQCIARLAPTAGFDFEAGMPFPEQLIKVQEAMTAGDERAEKIYRTVGTYFGYAIAFYAEFYDIHNLLILGRVTSGQGGDLILSGAAEILKQEFTELAEKITFRTPDEKFKRHGQAVIAASLPALG